jgi:uncharacterized repeat protein (TIGR03803 family)
MTYVRFRIIAMLAVIFLLATFTESTAQEKSIVADFIYKFKTERAVLRDNALISDGTFLYDVRPDGGINGGGSIFKIKPDGSGYSVLFHFENNSTGLNPVGTLVLSGTTLYGMTIFGGDNNMGIIFKIETDGTGFQKLLDFNYTNGALPYCSLIISGSTLYGISQQGGTGGAGLIFKLQTDGSGYQTLLNFDGANGWAPSGSLTLSGSTLYGVTIRGGAHDLGIVYAINTDGTGFKKLVEFEQNTGSTPFGSLTLDGTTLYGTTSQGGSQWNGTLFKVQTNGTDFQVLKYIGTYGGVNPIGKMVIDGSKIFGMTVNGGYSVGIIYSIDTDGNNFKILHSFDKTDGRNPEGSLTLIDGKLYGHISGGVNDYGVIFSINQDGTDFQKIKGFEATNQGYEPRGGLVLTPASGFGLTYVGGEFNKGVIYKVNNEGTGYQVLHNFNDTDGASPESTMTLSGNTLYGLTVMGGDGGTGTLFKIDTTGLNFEVLVNFTGDNGSFPVGSLVDDGANTLYGMTGANSSNNKGTVFKFDKTTKTLTTLYSFENTDAIRPYGAITLANSKLYGMSLGGVGDGIVFSLNLDGTGFSKILDKSSDEAGRYPNSLTVSGTTIYGTMTQGGTADWGTVFKVKTDGSGFQKLVDFVYGNGTSNGAIPTGATIVVGDSILYGLTKLGGPHDSGVAYSVRTDGSDFTILLNFDDVASSNTGRVKSSGMPMSIEGSLAFKNGFLYTPLSLQSGAYKTASIIKFDPKVTEVVTGIDERHVREISVYPNPTTNVIRLVHREKISSAYVVNAFGKKMNTRLENDSIDVSQLTDGIYFLVVGTERYKFIKL